MRVIAKTDAPTRVTPSRQHLFLTAFLLAALVAVICAGLASAKQTRLYTGVSFGPDGAGGNENFGNVQSVAVDQTSGDVFVYDIVSYGAPEGRLYKFSAAGAPIEFPPASGQNSIAVAAGPGGETEPGGQEIAVAPAGSPGGTAGDIYVANNATVRVYSPTGTELGAFGEGETCGVAVDPTGQVFVGSYGQTQGTIREYTPSANPANNTKTAEATVGISLCNVGADGAGTVYASRFDGSKTARLEGIADAEPSLIEPGGATLAADPVTDELYLDQGDHVSAYDPGGAPSYEFGAGQLAGSYGVATHSSANPSEDRVYVADGQTGTVKIFGGPLSYPTTRPATAVTTETATLNGIVYPEGRQYTGCRFEYGLVSASGFEDEGSCEPEASQIPPNASSQAVSLPLQSLQPNSDYKFRLVVTNSSGTIEGETLTFSTVGPPRIIEILSHGDSDSATLEATVDPRGDKTSYRIEWGPTDSYGNVADAGEVLASQGPTRVTAKLTNLAAASAYHFRIIAANAEGGEASSPDQLVETLNSCGFTDDRCLELVSRAEKGPLAGPGKLFRFGGQIQFQAATAGSGLAFTVYSGYPDATAGDGSIYLARRSEVGWSSEQITPPNSFAPSAGSNGSTFKVLSSDLGCGVVASSASLVPGAPTKPVETGGGNFNLQGGKNLYVRDDATGTYRLITNLPPAGPRPAPAEEYLVVGMSPGCDRVLFRTEYRYPGIPADGSASAQLYEWDNGALRNVAIIPGASAGKPVPVASIPGAFEEHGGVEGAATDFWRAVSADASHVVFTAVSQVGGDEGTYAIFRRDADTAAVLAGTAPATDISQSETATPNDGNSRYWTASTDGRRIFFTARYGLAANGSSSGATECLSVRNNNPSSESGEGCDLYEYDASAPAGERLTDLSPDQSDGKGAGVVGVLDASEDGSYIYFAARGRLGGAGRSEAENLKAATFNIYLAHNGAIQFVAPLGQAEVIGEGARALVENPASEHHWTSRSSGDGTKLVFESSLGVPGGVSMVHLYSAADGTDVCVSCRRDGKMPYVEHYLQPLIDAVVTNHNDRLVQPTILAGDDRLYFYSFDRLVPEAVEGARNLYQWEHGQISLIATEPAGVQTENGTPIESFLAGASADGNDLYFASPQSLTGGAEDGWNVYDARVGGGFPEPSPPAPCDATIEGACNSGGTSPAPDASPPTSSFGGPGNPPTRNRNRKHHHHKKKHHKKKHHKKRHHVQARKSRRADNNRRAGR